MRSVLGLASAALLAASCVASAPQPGVTDKNAQLTVTILHETHLHGTLRGRDVPPTAAPRFAHYAAALKAARGALPDPSRSLWLGNGDDLNGSTLESGRMLVEALGVAGLDANTLGYGELAETEKEIARRVMEGSRFAWVTANARDLHRPDLPFLHKAGTRLWVIRDLGGIRVGITGVVGQDIRPGDRQFRARMTYADASILDPVDALREVVPAMRREGADIVVVTSHMHFEENVRVAREVPGIAAIVGSHVHGFGEPPTVVNGTPVVAAFPDMEQVGLLELVVRGGFVISHTHRFFGPSAAADAGIAAILAGYADPPSSGVRRAP